MLSREQIQAMDKDQFQAIRQAYYKAAEGLRSLADELERAELLDEHIIACEAIEVINQSKLGVIL